MGDTSIEWTKRADGTKGKVWNPVTGCSKVSQGCKNCYAEVVANRFWGERAFTDVQCHEERLEQPLHWRKPARIFVNSMSDLFHEKVPDSFIARVVGVAYVARWHTFQSLTKRADRMARLLSSPKFYELLDDAICALTTERGCFEWPIPNLWLGVSVEDQKTADERIPLVLETPAAVRWVSYEPALGPIQIARYLMQDPMEAGGMEITRSENARLLDWLVCGGESGPGARPMHPDWARSVRDQCIAAGVPFFFKQWGEWEPVKTSNVVRPEDSGLLAPYVVACSTNRREVGSVSYHAYPQNITERGIGPFERMTKVGKKAAGRLLDGREWNEFPK